MKCKICDKVTVGYRHFCSTECHLKFSGEERFCVICNKSFLVFKKNKNKTCGDKKCIDKLKKEVYFKKFGVDNPSKNLEIKQKTKNTMISKYGVEFSSQMNSTKEIIKKYRDDGIYDNAPIKTKNTKLKKYNNENYNNREKSIQTLEKKYGKKIHPNTLSKLKERLKNKSVGFNSDKFKNVLLEKYNVKNPSQSQIIKNKINDSKLLKYGNINYNNREKFKKTSLINHNEIHPSKNSEIKTKISNSRKKTKYKNLFSTKYSEFIEPMFSESEYIGGGYNNLYKFKCKKCNNEFEHWIANGTMPRCKVCYPINSGDSKDQREIFEYLKQLLNCEVLYNDRKILDGKELDIFIPSKNIAIEYNGLYWHSELNGKDKNYHIQKSIKCKNKNIRLIQIFSDEWVNKNKIVKSRLKHIFGINDTIIYARKCEIKEIDSKIKNNFLNEYHIQAEDKSKIKLGLFYENELVSVMTFGNYRIALGQSSTKDEYELSRFASKHRIVGGAGKLLKHFIRNYKPKKIISYADYRWSDGNLYNKIGFNFIGLTCPNYWYIKDYEIREHRFKYRKNILVELLEKFDPALTEWQNMQSNNYDRIWDCGNLKFVWEE
jgi:hypothetical protein